MLGKSDLPNDPVKYLNETCNVRVGARMSLHHFEQAHAGEAEKYAKVMLAEQLGHSLLERMLVGTRDDVRQNERVYTAEAYVLTPTQAKVLYSLMRDEARQEDPNTEVAELKHTIDVLDEQLAAAKEAAARAAEAMREIADSHAELGAKRSRQIHKLELKVRALESSLAERDLMVERMSRKLRGEDDESV